MTEPGVRPPYRIETERTLLRCWSPSDAALLRASLDRSDAHLRPWIPFMKDEPRALEETADWLRARRESFDGGEDWCYGVFSPDESELIGETMLFGRAGPDALEIGYWTDVTQTRRGYCTEGAAAMARIAFEVFAVDRVEIWCAPGNPASAAIPAKLGFEHEATLKRRMVDTEGVRLDLMVWSLFAHDYPDSHANDFTIRTVPKYRDR